MNALVTTLEPLLFGPLRDHPAALPLAQEVLRVHRRYASEIVAGHRLCPFLRDVDSGFGRFCVAMSLAPDLADARDAFIRAESAVIHMVYPIVRSAPPEFERFGAEVGRAARDVWRAAPEGDARFGPEPPVIATFHPKLPGDRASPHRLIGVLRRAPDPFVQIIPGGFHESGTVVTSLGDLENLSPEAVTKILHAVPAPPRDRAFDTFERLTPALLDEIAANVADIHQDRERAYAPFLAELGAA